MMVTIEHTKVGECLQPHSSESFVSHLLPKKAKGGIYKTAVQAMTNDPGTQLHDLAACGTRH
jgi:hypothetical protein